MLHQGFNVGDFTKISIFLEDCFLGAPFFTSLKLAKRHVYQSLFHLQYRCYGFYEGETLVALGVFLKKNQKLVLENLLFSRENLPPQKALRSHLLLVGQREFVQRIELACAKDLFQEEFLVILAAKTALVLGGGGARGAYQLGVYQAFLEAEVSFDLVVGTSVGGLNGGLILEGNLEKAKELWCQIENNQILDFDYKKEPDFLYRGEFLKKVLLNAGISAAPLKKLIEDYVEPEKIQSATADFYVVTTEVPQLKEVVVDVKKVPKEEFSDWLVASASFFPGMALTCIQGQNYMDGGYKNNLPQDVALQHGAKLLVTIDAKGPGIIKKVNFPQDVNEYFFKTPWALGEVLYFAGEKAQENLTLGYLEGKKALFQAVGFWYTFTPEVLEKQFFLSQKFLKSKPSVSLITAFSDLTGPYGQSVQVFNLGFSLLELLGRYFALSPVKEYTLEEFLAAILKAYKNFMEKNKEVSFANWESSRPYTRLKRQQFTRLLQGTTPLGLGQAGLELLQDFLNFIIESRNEDGTRKN